MRDKVSLRAEMHLSTSSTRHAAALASCARTSSHLTQAALRYRRPDGHPFFNLIVSQKCELRLFPIWKASSTLLAAMLTAPGCEALPCACMQLLIDHTPSSTSDIPSRSRTRAARLRNQHTILSTAGFFSVALTREPTGRFLSGYHEHFIIKHSKHAELPERSLTMSQEGRLRALEHFVDEELAFVPASPALGRGFRPEWERDPHVAPQVTFLTTPAGAPHRIDYIGVMPSTYDELISLRVLHNMTAPLPYVRGKNSTVVMESRRVHPADLVTANATRLQRKICWLMQADYCCLGYRFPTACADMSALC